MLKSELIKAAAQIIKYAEYGYPSTPGAVVPPHFADSKLGGFSAVEAGGVGYGVHQDARAINAARQAGQVTFGAKAGQTMAPAIAKGTANAFGKVMLPVGLAFSAYGAGGSAMDLNKGFQSSNFNKGGFQPVQQMKYIANTTEGRNRFADVATNGGLTLAGAGIGAGVGAAFGGVGAVPGAMVGATVGYGAELLGKGYRHATGWDGEKYNQAKQLNTKGTSQDYVADHMQHVLSGKSNQNVFKTKTLFGGTRDLGEEAYQDSLKS